MPKDSMEAQMVFAGRVRPGVAVGSGGAAGSGGITNLRWSPDTVAIEASRDGGGSWDIEIQYEVWDA